jgi:hypothetical protein
MPTTHRFFTTAVFAGVLAVAGSACASRTGYYRNPAAVRVDNRAYDQGFQEGRRQGQGDARARRSYDYERHREFRDADGGWGRNAGDRNEYRRVYRDGFIAGYNDGYRQSANNRYPAYPNGSRYPDYRGSSVPFGAGQYGSQAAANGYRDGVAQGVDDARHGRRFDVNGARRFRDADHDYDGRYGSRDEYARDYRAGFQQGYEEGYRRRG